MNPVKTQSLPAKGLIIIIKEEAEKQICINLDGTSMFGQNFKEKNEVYIAIREEHLRCLPFGVLKSRNASAVMLSFYGTSEIVYQMLRAVSHKTRAYITNAVGLKGFLIPTITPVLRDLAV